MIHLPSTEEAGYIDGVLVPGPQYALDADAVAQGYTEFPAPAGIAYYGESGSDSSPTATSVDTSSIAGSLDVNSLSTLYLDSDAPDEWGIQLNAVLVNVTIQGETSFKSDPTTIWAQNVGSYSNLNDTLSLVDNTWNFTSSSESFPTTGNSTVLASDTSDENYDGELYIGTGPTFYAPEPFNLTLYLNTSLSNPFICSANSTINGSSPCLAGNSNYYIGDQTLFYNYSFSDAVTGQVVSGTYDWYTFHSGHDTQSTTNTRLAGFEANGKKADVIGLTNDWELDFGIGAYDGANQNVFSGNGTATLDYLNDCTAPTTSTPSSCTPSSSDTFQPVPAALNFGSETGEDTVGLDVNYNTTPSDTALFSAGPLSLHPLWGYSSQAGVAAGQTPVANDITVSGAPLSPLPAEPYIFVFLEDTSVSKPTAAYAWAPDTSTWYLMPGTYDYQILLADYTPVTGTLVVGTSPTELTATLDYNASEGVYTPLWALNNAQLAGISTSGDGQVGDQYVLFNNPDVENELGCPTSACSYSEFLTDSYDDYDFPSWAGLLLWGTTAYVNVHDEIPFLVGFFSETSGHTTTDYDAYIQQELYDTRDVTISNAAEISGWPVMVSLLSGTEGIPGAQNSIPVGDLMVWDSENTLIESDHFIASKALDSDFTSPATLMLFGGTDNTIWGNTFSDPSGVSIGTTYGGLAEAESGDLIYNNDFDIDNPVVAMFINPYTEECYTNSDGYCVLWPYADTWNISEEPATDVATVNGFSLTGNIVGSTQPFQGGNEWQNYGNTLNPATTIPYVDTFDYSDLTPTELGVVSTADQASIYGVGDEVPLLGFSLEFTSNLPSGTIWSVSILGVMETESGGTVTFPGVPNGVYDYTIGEVSGWVADSTTGSATVDGATTHATIDFTEFIPFTIAASPSAIDQGEGTTISAIASFSGGVAPYTCEWLYEAPGQDSYTNTGAPPAFACSQGSEPSSTIQSLSLVGVWSFVLEVTDSSSPNPQTEASAPALVTVNPTLAGGLVTIGTSNPLPSIDAGQAATLTANPVGGTAPYTYQWYQGTSEHGACSSGTPLGTGSTQSTGALTKGEYYYCYTVEDGSASGAESASSAWARLVVTDAVKPLTISVSLATIDSGQSVELSSEGFDYGVSPYVCEWLAEAPGGSFAPIGESFSCTNATDYSAPSGSLNAVGVWEFEFQVEDSSGAGGFIADSAAKSVTVNAPLAAPTISAISAFDVGQHTPISAVLPLSGGTGPYTCEWLWEAPGSDSFSDFEGSSFACAATGALSLPSISSGELTTVGTYQFELQVTDSSPAGSGTATSNVVSIVVSPVPTAGEITYNGNSLAPIDYGQEITLQAHAAGGTPSLSYVWYTGTGSGSCRLGTPFGGSGSTQLFDPASAGTYYLCYSVTDSSGAGPITVSTTWSELVVNAALSAPTISIGTSAIDAGQHTPLSTTGRLSGGTQPYTCQWLEEVPGSGTYADFGGSFSCTAAGVLSTPSTSTGDLSTAGTYSFELQVTDSSNAGDVVEASNAVSVVVSAPLTAGAITINGASPAPLDSGQEFTLQSNAQGGTPTLTYAWYYGAGSGACDLGTSFGGSSSAQSTSEGAGTYYFCYTVTDNSGAGEITVSSSWAQLVVNSPLSAPTISATSGAKGDPTIFVTSTGHLSGGTENYTCQWLVEASGSDTYVDLGSSFSCSAAGPLSTPSTTLATLAAGTYSVDLQVTDSSSAGSEVVVSNVVTATVGV